ncbi:amino acid adenylation domain-containing protein [Nonomuraea mesophila]|uniref:Phenyloxazoline synthase MbtB n=1 Tax=Nonomuraea mesophila TaxID=2530382 RepID=A0A4R5FTS1_9ACTN|nr:non-ribosomal peptide synthetase [Nonomuraea mesophila]TDE56537.1 amino acid adenylation domain-containing protein [Nonomuraea mesophila]
MNEPLSVSLDDLRVAVGELAEVSAEQVSEDTDLFTLGFDSIRLMRLVGWLRRQGVAVGFADLAEHPTVGEWWSVIRESGRRREITAPRPDVDEAGAFDLAVMQHAFWVGRAENQRLGGVAAHFYTEFDVEFDTSGGPAVDPGRLEPAWRALFARHGMLRVRIGDDGRQRIGEQPNWPGLRVHDLRGMETAEAERRLAATRESLSHRIMDIASGEVFDIQLSLFDGGSRLHVNLDMVAADALSLRVLLADLSELYTNGADADLPPLGYSYPRYRAERAATSRQEREQAAAWWRKRLADLPGPPALPVVPDDSAGARPTVVRRHHWIAPAGRQRLREWAHQRGLTPAMVLATAFAEVIARWSATDRFLLNLPTFDREPLHDDVGRLVGDFSSSVLLDVDLAEAMPFSARAARVQKDLREAMGHAAYTGVEVLRDLTRANGGEVVLAPVVFTSALELGELFAPDVRRCFGQPSWIISQGPQVWLDAQATELDEGLLVNWDARESVFPPGLLDEMFKAFVDLVEALIVDRTSWDAPAPRGLPAAQRPVRERVNDNDGPTVGVPLQERFFRLAEDGPDRIALVWTTPGDGGTDGSMTYGELSLRARRVAGLLHARGIRPGDTVGITLSKGPDQVIAVLGALAAGAAYVPSGLDVPPARRAQVYGAAGVTHVLTDQEHDWPPGITSIPMEDAVRFAPLPDIAHVDPESVMYVLFTSGSTGVPKGVEVPHRAVANTIDAVNDVFGVDGSDRTMALSSLDFDLSAYDMFAFLSRGGSVAVLHEEQRRDARAWARMLRRWDVTVVSCVPALLDMLLVAGSRDLPGSRLRLVMLGGDWVTVDLPGRLRELVPGCRFAGLGGMTEAAIHTTVREVDQVDPAWRAVPYGRPLRNMRCRVADARGEDRPDWVPGELWVSGPGVARGYRGDPERTAEKFVEVDGRRWYRTGDLARYLPDGTLEFLGRSDHQVKIRGHRIELGEIEAHLAAHPGVGRAIATVVQVAAGPRLAAAVVASDPETPGRLEADSLRHWLGERVPRYMVPEVIRVLEGLPLTGNGKIDRKAIHAAFAFAGRDDGFEPPVGVVEETVAALWRELLGAERVGRRDGFFALGGDSLLATRLVNRLREAGMRGAEIAHLFETPALAEFAEALTPGAGEAPPVLVPDAGRRFDPFPLTEVQQAYWLGRSEGLALGGVPAVFRLTFDGAGVDLDRLRQALERLVARHDMLRAVIGDDGTQRILPETPPVTIQVLDAAVPDPEFLYGWAGEPGRWPLFDVRAVRYGDGRTRLAVSVDAVAFDALSVNTMIAELAQLYAEPAAELPPIGVTFRDYVMNTPPSDRTAAEAYWRERLAELPPGPQLPLDADPAAVRPRFTRRAAGVPAGRWKKIKERAREHGLTPSVVLLECYGRVLSRWSDRQDLTVNLTLFDRHDVHPDIGRVLGDFTTLLPLEYRPVKGEGWLVAARRLQARLGRDLEHRAVSSIWVQRELARGTDAPSAAFPVVFTSTLGLGGEPFSGLPEAFPRWVGGASQTPQVWLDHQLFEHEGELQLVWDAVDELFPPGVLDAMFAAYRDLLVWLGDEEDWSRRPVMALPVEQRLARERVNATTGQESGRLLHEAFFERAAADPGHTALLCRDGEQVSYGVLADRALRVAALLAGRGVRPGDPVAVSLPKGPDQIAAVLGTLAAGGVYVPVGVDQPELRRRSLMERAGVVTVLDDLAGADQCEPLSSPVAVAPEALAYVIFTSGSTGEPKGVEISHRSAVNTVDDIVERYGVGPADRVLAVSALDFDLSVFDVFGLLGAGGALVLIGEDDRRDAQRWVELVRRHRVTVWNTVPALLEMLVTVAEMDRSLPGSLRLAMVSGDWVGLDLPGRLRSLVPGCDFVALGGATEASIWSNAFEVTYVDPEWSSIPYGYPLRNQRFRVMDQEDRDCPDWVPGELWIGGIGVAAGYRGDEGRTADKFVEDDAGRWYRTGDLGRYWPDGTLEFLGRRDTQVKVRGHRIELGEIEAALAAHPAVAQAVCVAPGERNRRRLVAFVQGSGGLDGLAEFLAERLPTHAIPAQIISVASFPLTANGKVDRAALTSRADRAPERGFEAPVGVVEETVAGIWGDLLGVSRVGRHDGFFALGGDSLLATRLVDRLRRAGLGGAELAALFVSPGLADFAATLEWGEASPAKSVVADREGRFESFGLTEVQQAYWLGRQSDFVLGGVGAQFYVEYEHAEGDLGRLEEAWNRLVVRHDMLRAVVEEDGTQRVLPRVPRYRFAVVDGDARVVERVREEMSRRLLDPGSWPLFDIRAVRCGGSVRLCVTLDNLVVDGLSMLIIFAEWERLTADPDVELPAIGITFRDYVLQAQPDESRLAAAEAYWLRRAAELPPGPRLPVLKDPGQVEIPRFHRRESKIDGAAWHALTEQARLNGLTPSVLLLACFAEVLSAWSGQPDLTVNLTLFDRRDVHPDIGHVVGDFTSLLLVAYRRRPEESWLERVRRLQEQVWRDLDHQEISGVRVLREMARQNAGLTQAVPVVFTSMLGIDDALARTVRWPDHTRSQTPQVWLDHQAVELPDGVLLSWDSVDELFPSGLVDTAFTAYLELVERLTRADWTRPIDPSMPGALEPMAEPAPVDADVRTAHDVGPDGPPQGEVEQSLAVLWGELLGRAPESRTDNFFVLGGDSLGGTRMLQRAAQKFGVDLSLRAFFAAPVLAVLARDIDEQLIASDALEDGTL